MEVFGTVHIAALTLFLSSSRSSCCTKREQALRAWKRYVHLSLVYLCRVSKMPLASMNALAMEQKIVKLIISIRFQSTCVNSYTHTSYRNLRSMLDKLFNGAVIRQLRQQHHSNIYMLFHWVVCMTAFTFTCMWVIHALTLGRLKFD